MTAPSDTHALIALLNASRNARPVTGFYRVYVVLDAPTPAYAGRLRPVGVAVARKVGK